MPGLVGFDLTKLHVYVTTFSQGAWEQLVFTDLQGK